ncbi:6-phosphogluconolactonase [Chelativorans sp. J32]|uniref:6-phosphogluconolactonase n=1 Tax=Chelativorans sp. J32 TaxID=935840 RepID=UPI000484060B|nr:6-phosphogluconolactonase [Chelativorans sp. J32]
MADVLWHDFTGSEVLAEALAETVAMHLADAIEKRGAASIAVSGGSTPPPFFRALSRQEIDWTRVTITLVDERFVPPSSERSNAALASRHLLQNNAAKANFIGLYQPTETVEDAAERADEKIGEIPLPLDVVVLGMGPDGHTASFFPDAEDIALKMQVQDRRVLPIYAKSAGEPRLTLSMPLISQARFIAVHIEGEEKRQVLETTLSADGAKLPIRIAVEQAAAPVSIYWAPGRTTP